MTQRRTVGVIGAGSWGTALALQLARNKHEVHLWSNESWHVDELNAERENKTFLPGFELPDNIYPTKAISDFVKTADDILIAVPSHAFTVVIDLLKPFHQEAFNIISATKGISPKTGNLLSDYVYEAFGEQKQFATISGPSFALEVAKNQPTAVVAASKSAEFSTHCADLFSSALFRVYTSSDVIGVQIGGSVKNVLAVGAGIADGLGFGANARAALLTRGLNEMMQLGIALGGQQQTFLGLTGTGDTILTCTDNLSRNRRFGLAIAKDSDLKQAEKEIGQAVEAIRTSEEIHKLSKKHSVEMPICETVYRIIHEGLPAREAVQQLLSRGNKPEFNI